MTSQTGQQLITIDILPNISKSKGNQAMKFGHLTAWEIFFFINYAEEQAIRLVPDLFLCFFKALHKIKKSI